MSFPLTQEGRNKTDSIVASITMPHFGIELYPTPEEKAVAYLYFLINDHPFVDGNKRTAVLTFLVLCELNALEYDRSISLDALAVFIEKTKDGDYHRMIQIITALLFPASFKL